MKKITIKGASNCTEVGGENPRLAYFEIEGPEEMEASDGSHTFDELYQHRYRLYIVMCSLMQQRNQEGGMAPHWSVWRSQRHSDGELAFGGGWFVLGVGDKKGYQITYHLPMDLWGECDFADTLYKAPEWDGHTADDVLKRLPTIAL